MSDPGRREGSWTLLTGHGHVLVEITRNRYTVNPDSLFRHPAQDGHQVGPFLALLAASGNVVTGGGVSR